MPALAFVSRIVVHFGVVIGCCCGFFFSLRNWLRDPIFALTGRDIFPQDIYFLSSIPAHTNLGDLLTLCTTYWFDDFAHSTRCASDVPASMIF